MPVDGTSGYSAMWIVAMFDLPTKTKEERREYTRFRNHLLGSGYSRLQYSVYARFCINDKSAQVQARRIRAWLPPEGQVRVMELTDRQFGRMKVFWGESEFPPEKPPDQLVLF